MFACATGSASAATDLALNQAAASSSNYNTTLIPANAVDGNTTTRWAAAQNKTPDQLWVRLANAAQYNINEVSIQWGTDYPTSYRVEVSPDMATWTTIYSTTTGNGGTDDLTGLSGTGEYVRVTGLNQNDQWGNSIYNLSVYGTAAGSPPPPPPPSGAVAPAAPTGPATPTGGWRVEYADAFGSCFTNTATMCSAGYTRADSTLTPYVAGPWSPANSLGGFDADQNDVTAQGLAMHCIKRASHGYNYSCGDMNGNGFTFIPGRHYVIQFAAQLPDNLNNMEDPAVWSTGNAWAWEIDFPEWWGYTTTSTTDSGWCDQMWTYPGVPKNTGGSTGQTYMTFCKTAGLNYDPAAGVHVYTMDLNGGQTTGYVDGTQVSSRSFSFNTGTVGKLILQNMLRKLNSCACDTGRFPAGGTTMLLRYVAVYEPSSANNAGTNGPSVAPGTSVQ